MVRGAGISFRIIYINAIAQWQTHGAKRGRAEINLERKRERGKKGKKKKGRRKRAKGTKKGESSRL